MENWKKQYEKQLQLLEDLMIVAREEGDEEKMKFLFNEQKRIEFEYSMNYSSEQEFMDEQAGINDAERQHYQDQKYAEHLEKTNIIEINIGDIFQTRDGEWFRITNIKGSDIFWRPLKGGYTEWSKSLPAGSTLYVCAW